MVTQEVFQPWDGGRRRRTIYLSTVDSTTSIPSINNSRWIRGAFHSEFSSLIRWISARSSQSTRGRPPTCPGFQRQQARKPRRLQRITVSGWTMMIASRSDRYSRYSDTNSKRSMFYSLARIGDLRRSTASCWRRMILARRVYHDRTASSSWTETRPSAASLPDVHPRVILTRFWEAQLRQPARAGVGLSAPQTYSQRLFSRRRRLRKSGPKHRARRLQSLALAPPRNQLLDGVRPQPSRGGQLRQRAARPKRFLRPDRAARPLSTLQSRSEIKDLRGSIPYDRHRAQLTSLRFRRGRSISATFAPDFRQRRNANVIRRLYKDCQVSFRSLRAWRSPWTTSWQQQCPQ
jgi:hypothetical protein